MKELVGNFVGQNADGIKMSSNLYADLGIDSLMKVEILVANMEFQQVSLYKD